MLLGQVGFLDKFTVTMHRHAQALAVEAFEAFDWRSATPFGGGPTYLRTIAAPKGPNSTAFLVA